MAKRRKGAGRGARAEREFLSEAEEILERLREGTLGLGELLAAGREADPEAVNALFRAAHSLKGLAGLFGFEPVQALAHHLEDVLDGLRLGRFARGAPAAELVGEGTELLARLLPRLGDSEALRAEEAAIGAFAVRAAALRGAPAAAPELAAPGLDPVLLRALTEYEEHRLRESLRRGRRIALVEADFAISAFEEGLGELCEALRRHAELISTLPSPGDAPESQIRFALLAATDLEPEALLARLDHPGARLRAVAGADPPGAPAPRAAPGPAPAPPTAVAARVLSEGDPEDSLRSLSGTVRVDIRKLDELMNLVGELVLQRGALGTLLAELAAAPPTAGAARDLEKIHKALDRQLRRLQEAVLDVRMVPLRQVFAKLSRVVRGLRRELDKDVRLEIAGADTELDKLLVEELVDPLMHVVRNAFDHGIEAPELRRAAGKNPVGTIRLAASSRGSHVVISVCDDGAGIDRAGLRARAEAAGILLPGQVLSERETLDLVFEPGLSTSSAVTETSGRGVGMDVVRANLTALGGAVGVESAAGRGTTVSLTLPITLAILPALVVRASGQRFAIPLTAVLETLRIEPAAIQRSEGRELLSLRGEPLPLRRLAAELGLPPGPGARRPCVAVLGQGDLRLGLLVDDLEGQQDAVIKAIQGPIAALRGIAGAAELGHPEAVLVLDVAALFEDATRRREAA